MDKHPSFQPDSHADRILLFCLHKHRKPNDRIVYMVCFVLSFTSPTFPYNKTTTINRSAINRNEDVPADSVFKHDVSHFFHRPFCLTASVNPAIMLSLYISSHFRKSLSAICFPISSRDVIVSISFRTISNQLSVSRLRIE